MKKEVEIQVTPKEIAEQLFQMDEKQVAEMFAEWKIIFDKCRNEREENGDIIWIHDLNHFLTYVVNELDDDGKDMIRCMYSQLVYKLVDDASKKHLTELIL